MKAARYYGNRDVRIDDVDRPSPAPGEVLIDVTTCGICGSDLAEYLHGPRAPDEFLPYTMGHELGGTVAAVGEGVEDVDVGADIVLNPLVACEDCASCDRGLYNLCENLTVVGAQRPGGYAEFVTAPATNVIPIPDGVDPELAAVAEPVAVAYHSLLQSPLKSGGSCSVIGLGPIGLGMVQLATDMGVERVYASGHREARMEIARECGADVVLDPREEDLVELIRSEEAAGGVDVAFEVTGTESGFEDAVRTTRAAGHTELVGVFEGDIATDPSLFVGSQRTAQGSAAYHTGPLAAQEFAPIMKKFADGDLDAEILATSQIPLDDIVDRGFEELADSDSEEVKVLVSP